MDGDGGHAAVSPRPPSSLSRITARTGGYTYAANMLALCLILRATSTDSQLHRCTPLGVPVCYALDGPKLTPRPDYYAPTRLPSKSSAIRR